jgi:hypothetical protein
MKSANNLINSDKPPRHFNCACLYAGTDKVRSQDYVTEFLVEILRVLGGEVEIKCIQTDEF